MFWRISFALATLALAVLVWVIVTDNVRTENLRDAVARDDVNQVATLLTRNPDLVATQVWRQGTRELGTTGNRRWHGRLLIHEAVRIGSVRMAETLLTHGADLNSRLEGDTLLHVAARTGDTTMVAWLLDRGADANAVNGCEHPASARCLTGNWAEAFGEPSLAGSGTVCTGCEHKGRTPLHAVDGVQVAEVTALLLTRGANVHAVDGRGRTPLHIIAIAGASDAARVLCAHGADPAVRDLTGKTPAGLAADADLEAPGRAWAQSGVGELAGWLAPGGGCAAVAARARESGPVAQDEVNAAWAEYVCGRDSSLPACSE